MSTELQIFSQRLRQARIMAKMSLRGLWDAIGKKVSYNTLSKYKKGKMMPTGEVLADLSTALRRPPDFFFRTFELNWK